jgi:hypothetical protein
MGVPLKTEQRRSHTTVASFGQRVRRAVGVAYCTSEVQLDNIAVKVVKDEDRIRLGAPDFDLGVYAFTLVKGGSTRRSIPG